MFGWLSRSALPEAATIDWLFDVFGWLLAETGGFAAFRSERVLVLPTDAFFPVSARLEPARFAEEMFAATRRHARLDHLPCRLEADEELPSARDILGNVPYEESSVRAAGTFRHGAGVGKAVISYAPSGLKDPEAFVATMAHELGHFLIHGFQAPAPGGDEAQEPATDVCAIFLGFGVFTANASFRFTQYQDGVMQGWSTSRLGYLGERPLSYALAIFLALLEIDPRTVRGHLRENIRGYVKNAALHLARERQEALAQLRAISATATRASAPVIPRRSER